jgi:predicted DNA-binding transcriptional regulator YafY
MASYTLLANTLRVHEQLLRSRPGVKLSKNDLSKKIRISEKQVDACIQFLRELGYPVLCDVNRWHYSENPEEGFGLVTQDLIPRLKRLPKRNIALLLTLQKGMESIRGTNFWGRVNTFLREQSDDHFLVMDSKLKEVFSFRQRTVQWADPVSFERVAEAVYERKQLRFFYTKLAHPVGEQRTVNPYRMVCMDDIWYLLGFDLKRNAMRTFALTRIENAEQTGLSFERPTEGLVESTLRDAFGMMGRKDDAPTQLVRLQFNAYAATRVRERKWHEDQTELPLPDGGVELCFQLAQLSEVLEWILSWGEHVRVCEPQELVDRLRRRLWKTLALYTPTNPV